MSLGRVFGKMTSAQLIHSVELGNSNPVRKRKRHGLRYVVDNEDCFVSVQFDVLCFSRKLFGAS